MKIFSFDGVVTVLVPKLGTENGGNHSQNWQPRGIPGVSICVAKKFSGH
jgi:hypothetical protein